MSATKPHPFGAVVHRTLRTLLTGLPRLATDATGHCHGVSIPPPLITPAAVAEMRRDARALLAPQICEIVERAPQPFFQAIFDLESP